MSATIKYKGNTIATITTDSSKTLKTSGKYCEGDIVVENVQDGGGGGKPMVETICEVAGNSNVSSNWSPSVTAVEYILKKYYYNGVLLPEIPAVVLAEYPYAWIRYNSQTGYYDLLLSETVWWWSDATTMSRAEGTTKWFRVPINNAVFGIWEANADSTSTRWGIGETQRYIIWANHDIPKGSATATEIYFEGSEPVPAE